MNPLQNTWKFSLSATRTVLVALLGLTYMQQVQAQDEKVKFGIYGRGLQQSDRLDKRDTLNVDRTSTGSVLMDLGFKITPDKKTEINAILRLRSQLGSFYAAGDESILRWIYIRGIIAKTVNYELGDIRLQLSPYTMYNNDGDAQISEAAVFSDFRRDYIQYENFNKGNSWWQQGAHADFSIGAKTSFLDQVKFDVFFLRNRNQTALDPASFQTGGRVSLLKTSRYNLAANYINLYEIGGTQSLIAPKTYFHNPVGSGELTAVLLNRAAMRLNLLAEGGLSQMNFFKDTLAPTNVNGAFFDAGLSVDLVKLGINVKATYRSVDPYFYSSGAQSKRVNFATSSNDLATFPIYGNDPLNPFSRSVSMFDMIHDPGVMNTQITAGLMAYNPVYGNATPFGVATPNRTGVDIKATWNDKNEKAGLAVNTAMLQEVVPAGSLTEKRSFMVIGLKANANIHKIIGWEKRIVLHGGFRMDQTNRPGVDSIDFVDLSSNLVDAGLELELIKKLDLLAGIKMNMASGTEYTALYNNYFQPINWNTTFYKIDQTETMIGYGARYRFSNASYLTLQHHLYNLEDAKTSARSVKFDRISLMFNLSF
ncbi:MAG: hypothetical protein MUF42_00335 [Cytophagaceae bacterium]|jgi:hypothetical protein|nr:hypothetical protein [Cytophagaceae bacterium]